MNEIPMFEKQMIAAPPSSRAPNARLNTIQSRKYPMGMARYSRIEAAPTVLYCIDFAMVPYWPR